MACPHGGPPRALRFRRWWLAAIGGAGLMYLFDPVAGRGRRLRLAARIRKVARRAPHEALRTGHHVTGTLQGAAHEMTTHLPGYIPEPLPDRDQFIAQRVASVLGHIAEVPLGNLSLDATDGVVRVRGTVANAMAARRVVDAVAAVPGVRAAVSLMRTPGGDMLEAYAGTRLLSNEPPRAALYAEAVRRALLARWPALTDDDIVAAGGHIDALVAIIAALAHEPEEDVRRTLDALVLAAV